MKHHASSRFLLLAALATADLAGQSAPALAPSASLTRPATDEVVELSPFTVDASKDKGYRAENTLAGSRLNANLRDTPASVTVFTKEFLEDIGLNEIEKIIDYSVGSQANTQDVNAAPNANNMLGGANLIRRIDVRGIIAAQGVDFFKSITVNDGYRIDRYDESRGPNGILFGVGSAGGMINQSSVLASTHRNSGRVSYEFGEYSTSRVMLRLNQVVVPKQLAVAVAAVDQENSGWRKPDSQDKERLYGTVTFSPTDKITFRAMGERGHEHRSSIAPYLAFDGALAWLDNRKAKGVDAVTFTPTNVVPTAAQMALGVVSRNAAIATTTRRFIYLDNNATFFDSTGTFLTGSYNNPVVRAPDGTPGVTGVTLAINDPAFLPYNINSGGPGMYRDTRLTNYTASLDWRITSRLNLNLSHNFQKIDLENPLIKGSTPMISGEANRLLAPNGAANPYVGQLYIDAPWYNELHSADYRESRLAFSYDLETKWSWLGTHRIAGLYARTKETDRYNAQRLGVMGAPFNADPQNANNLVIQRVYLDEKNPASFVAADWHRVPSTLTDRGLTYNVGWIDGAAGTTNSYAEQEMDAKLIVAQSHFLQRRVVTTFGYRVDEGDVTTFGFAKDPVLKTDILDLDPAKATTNHVKGITRTQGLVLHATSWLSLLGNRSSNIGIPTFTNKVFPRGATPDPSKGEGEDYGFALDLLANRLSLKAVAFKTSKIGETKSGGINAQYNLRNVRIADALQGVLVGPGRPISTADWAAIRTSLTPPANSDYFNEDSKGYEVSAVANFTPRWRLTATYSYTDRIRSGTSDADAIPWYGYTYDGKLLKEGVTQNANGTWNVNASAFTPGGTVAKWIELGNRAPAANLSTLTTTNGNTVITVAEEIRNMIAEINDDKLQNEQGWGLRPHKVSLFTAYDFTEGRLKGFSTGFGYRWRSDNLVGRTAAGAEVRGRALVATDLMLRYRHVVSAGRFRGTLSYQLNVSNVFNQDGIIPQRFAVSPEYQVPGGRGVGYSRFDLVEPRYARVTTTFSY